MNNNKKKELIKKLNKISKSFKRNPSLFEDSSREYAMHHAEDILHGHVPKQYR